jgi:hypothetical protein
MWGNRRISDRQMVAVSAFAEACDCLAEKARLPRRPIGVILYPHEGGMQQRDPHNQVTAAYSELYPNKEGHVTQDDVPLLSF